jgi:transcription antitermination factor NusG
MLSQRWATSGEEAGIALPDNGRWYAVHTRSNFEKTTTAELATRAIENYLPLYEEIHEWKDRKRRVALPLFPGYVFARFLDEPGLRRKVLTAHGVVRILGLGGAIEPIPDEQIKAIQAVLSSGVAYFTYPLLCEGSHVRVVRGPLAGLEGSLARINKRARLVVSLPLLGQSVTAEVNTKDVEVVRGTGSSPVRV